MQDATELGKILRRLMVDKNLRQEQLAKELGVSTSILSNYITGKNIPEMKLIAKCIKYFNLEGKEIKELFTRYFSSMAKDNGKIILDTQFFKPERINLLVKLLTILLLYPYDDLKGQEEKSLSELNTFIGSSFDNVRYAPPPD